MGRPRTVRSVVVHDQVDVHLPGHCRVDRIEDLPKSDGTMPSMKLGHDRGGCDVERRKQRRRAMPFVIVGPSLGLPRAHRQQRLRAIERLNLRFLIQAEHHRVFGRVHVQPDDVAHFFDQSGSFDNLNVSLRCGWSPNARARCAGRLFPRPLAFAIPRLLQCVAPRGFFQRADDHLLDFFITNLCWRSLPAAKWSHCRSEDAAGRGRQPPRCSRTTRPLRFSAPSEM